MARIELFSRITPDPARSLGRVYDGTFGRTTPAGAACSTDQTPGTTP
jgi:hypothetical protein